MLADAAAAGFAPLCRRVRQRYAGCSRYTQGYVGWKLRLDPVHRAVLALAAREPFGEVLDLGCGRGQLAAALLEAGLAPRVTGIDWDERQLADARRAAGPAAAFRQGDLCETVPPPCDTALLIDLLYQLPAEAQLSLLQRVAEAARSLVILRVLDPDRGWRSLAASLMEGWISLARLNRPHAVRPLPVRHFVRLLEGAGFTVSQAPCWAGTPLPNLLLVARR